MRKTTTLEYLLHGPEYRPEPAQRHGNGHHGIKAPVVTIRPQKVCEPGEPRDRAGTWLRAAGISLAGLAAAAAAVSYWAQFTFIDHVKHQKIISYIQAGIPDAGALVFACLGIALALHGRRAIRPRFLNLACVGLSILMNALGAARGWRPTAVWVMAPVIYAVASDTLIGVLRAYAIARHKALHATLAADDSTPLQVVGAFLLWVLRLVMDPRGTVRGFRAWVLSTPASPKPRPVAVTATRVIAPRKPKVIASGPREGTKTARMIALAAAERDLLTIPPGEIARLATAKAAEVGLDGGAARAALARHVRTLQNGGDHLCPPSRPCSFSSSCCCCSCCSPGGHGGRSVICPGTASGT